MFQEKINFLKLKYTNFSLTILTNFTTHKITLIELKIWKNNEGYIKKK